MKKNNSKWIDKTKLLPEPNRAIECKDKDGDILIGTGCGENQKNLTLNDLSDEYITHWRYV